MAATNYNEISHSSSSQDCDVIDPLYRYDTHFPERLSRLHLTDEICSAPSSAGSGRKRRQRPRNCARFKTQPITFDEIKEVDEESTEVSHDLKTQFTAFSRSMDGLIPNFQDAAASKQQSKSPSPSEAGPAAALHDNSEPMSISPDQHGASCVVPGLSQIPRLELSRTRRSKRRSRKGIEEEPEQEAAASQDAA